MNITIDAATYKPLNRTFEVLKEEPKALFASRSAPLNRTFEVLKEARDLIAQMGNAL